MTKKVRKPDALPHALARVAEIPGARGKVPRSFIGCNIAIKIAA